jgi:hypothetical protein
VTYVIKYEKRGDFDNSRLKEALVFTIDDSRLALFKHHDPSLIGVSITLPNGSAGCFSMTCGDFYNLFMCEWFTQSATQGGNA